MSSPILTVRNLSKSYRLYDRHMDRLKESLHPFGKSYHREFFALDGINFELSAGDTLGIVGKNGAGKSTLLQIIAGVLTPSSGEVITEATVSAILELGAGFNPQLSGLENIYFNGMLMGFSRQEMENRLAEILAFAELGDFIHQPMKIYSTGMYVRLAFAVATSVNPDILIVDEALSVGDMFFQAKCMMRIQKMIRQGTALILVSHSTDVIKNICSRAIYLDGGRIKSEGESLRVADDYTRDITSIIHRVLPEAEMDGTGKSRIDEGISTDPKLHFKVDPDIDSRVGELRYGTGGARLKCLEILDEKGQVCQSFAFNEKVVVRAHIEINKELDSLNCCLLIRNKDGIDLLHTTSREADYHFPSISAGRRLIVDISFRNVLCGNQSYMVHYTVNNTYSLHDQEVLDLIEVAGVFSSRFCETNPVWHGVWHPFQFEHRVLGEEVAR